MTPPPAALGGNIPAGGAPDPDERVRMFALSMAVQSAKTDRGTWYDLTMHMINRAAVFEMYVRGDIEVSVELEQPDGQTQPDRP